MGQPGLFDLDERYAALSKRGDPLERPEFNRPVFSRRSACRGRTCRPRWLCCYEASDSLEGPQYRGLTPDDLIDIAVVNRLHFHGATQEGAMFHLLGALSELGKFVIDDGGRDTRSRRGSVPRHGRRD